MILGTAPDGVAGAEASGVIPAGLAAAFAWADGASRSSDADGRSDTSGNPYPGTALATAWMDGASEPRDIDGDVYRESFAVLG